MKSVLAGLATASVIGALAGCSSAPTEPAPTASSSSVEASLPLATSTFQPGPDAAYEGLVIVGDLVRDGECVRLEAEENSMVPGTLDILWPRGSTAQAAAGEIEVFGADGTRIAVTGTHVKVVGGSAQVEASSPCLSKDRSRIELQIVELAE